MTGESHPNFAFIVVDNVGCGDIGCYGGLAPTPRIDAPIAARLGAPQQSMSTDPNIKAVEDFTGYGSGS